MEEHKKLFWLHKKIGRRGFWRDDFDIYENALVRQPALRANEGCKQ